MIDDLTEDMHALSPHLLVPFIARRLPGASIAWMNLPYLAEGGLNVLDADEVDNLRRSLLDSFGVSTVAQVSDNQSPLVTLFADRYGSSDGTPHGGSGRCGILGCFNAKGVGPTPLVPSDIPWDYSHGMLYMHDAIREAIAGEIARAELPNGSIPVIAIIDTGVDIRKADDDSTQRCAILVRPNFVRAAHLERSILFGSAGDAHSDQFNDNLRVRDINKRLYKKEPGLEAFTVTGYINAVAKQIASMRALRLWYGRPVTSNLTIYGGFYDYGAFRALPHWGRADDGQGQTFGIEAADIYRSINSLCFYENRFANGQHSPHSQVAIAESANYLVADNFKAICINACFGQEGDLTHDEKDEFGTLFEKYYHTQQTHRYSLTAGEGGPTGIDWIGKELRCWDPAIKPRQSSAVLAHKILTRSSCLTTARYAALSSRLRAVRFFKQRPRQFFSSTQANAMIATNLYLSKASESRPERERIVSNAIDIEVCASRRHWPNMPDDLIIIGNSRDKYGEQIYAFSTTNLCFDIVYLRYISANDDVFIDARKFKKGELVDCLLAPCPEAAQFLISMRALERVHGFHTEDLSQAPMYCFGEALDAVQSLFGDIPWRS